MQPQNRSPGLGAPASAWRLDVIRASFLSPLSRKASQATFLIIVTLMQRIIYPCPWTRKLQNIIYEDKRMRRNSGPAFLDAAGQDGEMRWCVIIKQDSVPVRWRCWGNRESGILQERFQGMRIVLAADPNGPSVDSPRP